MSLAPVPWDHIAGRIQHRIIRPPEVNPHITVLGQTGSGKDHMVRYGILPVVPLARVVVLITKRGGDQTWEGFGTLLAGPGELPVSLGQGPDGTPRWRVPLTPDRVTRKEVQRLLKQLADVGEVIVVIGDAARLSTRESDGGFNLERDLSNMMTEGREANLTVIACANSAAWASSGLKDQAAAVLIGRTGGTMLKDFADIAGLPGPHASAERRALETLAPQWWLYADHVDGPAWVRVGTPPAAGSVSEAWPPAEIRAPGVAVM